MSQTPTDPFEFLKTLWNPMGLPMAGMVAPVLNLSELDKRIADLKSVENWLNMNLNILHMTIQGLEMQKATLAAMQEMQDRVQQASNAAAAPGTQSQADAWWNVLQQGQGGKPGPDGK